ncbi:SDR family NAD(P)-dependent oxidoreductase [Streptomyces sp. NBC_01320]|uniref:SDR family NAD(P)-dependent oxidoreductase n=1 Tax=Streptomyces sp. NBC_01320 TaxID=2903824 RepID=UPI002E1457D4|nr:SDR family oxidoreductase [Streptomyces sp. NBC_01320]
MSSTTSALLPEGKVVFVTGGSGHLGSQFARSMSAAGAKVVIGGRNVERLEAMSRRIQSDTGRDVRYVSGDLTDASGIPKLVEDAWSAFGRVDTIVNSAVPAGSPQEGDLLTTPDEAWLRFFDPVVLGVVRLSRELAPRMAETGGGSFINVVSPTGIVPSPGVDAYGVAKGALIMLTKYMAREWGTWNIRANGLSPGLIVDDQYVTPETIPQNVALSAALERTSLGRWGLPEDLVGVATFLASDAAAFISGQVISVDGGRF